MSIKQLYIQNYLKKMLDVYKVLSLLILLTIAKKDFKTLKFAHKYFVKITNNITSFVEKMCTKQDIKNFKNKQYKKLPDYLEELKIFIIYKESVTEVLTGFAFQDEENILMNKMGLELDNQKELAYMNISQMLNKMKKYPEAINTLYSLNELLNSTPVMNYAAKIFQTTEQYDKSIECYQKILKMWPKNRMIERKLYKICDEVLS